MFGEGPPWAWCPMGCVGVLRSREGSTALALQALHSAQYIRTCEPEMTWQVACQGNSTQNWGSRRMQVLWAGEGGVGPLAQLTVLFTPSSIQIHFLTPVHVFNIPIWSVPASLPPPRQLPLNQLFPHCQHPCYERQRVDAAVLIRVPPPPTPEPETGSLWVKHNLQS